MNETREPEVWTARVLSTCAFILVQLPLNQNQRGNSKNLSKLLPIKWQGLEKSLYLFDTNARNF